MRDAHCEALIRLSKESPFIFMTGDLGYKALEPLQQAMGERFINAGVAEQNMVSTAAGIASGGLQTWVYSIAPFVYARPFEQIRNDLCLQNRDVKLVGNGGGYGYGSMGSSHHAIEDYGALLTLGGMRVFVPAFDSDVEAVVRRAAGNKGPCYLRLGRDEAPQGWQAPAYAPWRRLNSGAGPVLLAVGPLAATLTQACAAIAEKKRPRIWLLSELPLLEEPPADFLRDLKEAGHLCVVEEHVPHGGAGQLLAHWLALRGLCPTRFSHRHALGYPSGTYGSQGFHRKESGLDAGAVLKFLEGDA
jgi:transketolase